MISLTLGLGGLGTDGGGSYMRLIYAPFFLMPAWSGYVNVGRTGGHSSGTIGEIEYADSTYFKVLKFLTEVEGKTFKKTFRVKFPIPKVELINIQIRAVKVIIDEK